MKRLNLTIVCLAFALGVIGDAQASSQRHCPAFAFKHNGVPWKARSIRTTALSCSSARGLIKAYAIPRNCQFRTPCHTDGYVCTTSQAEGSMFTEACSRPGHAVTWRGSYTSR